MVQSALASEEALHRLGPEKWIERMRLRAGPDEYALIERAWYEAETVCSARERASGESYMAHGVAVASLLAGLGLDAETLAAALLHDVPDLDPDGADRLHRRFGSSVAGIASGVCRMHDIGILREPGEGLRMHSDGEAVAGERGSGERIEGLRKMLLAMARDVRVVFIALAERLHDLRTADGLPDEQRQRLAHETREIHAPLANRLGVWQLKWELEDLTFRFLEPETYRDLASRLAERRRDREAYVEDVRERLERTLAQLGVEAEVHGRPKHLYSIHRKMQRKGVRFEDLFDLLALRVLVEDERSCYAALGVVHSLWKPIRGEFDDYIANPKDNNYRSLHTAVVGPAGKSVEVQIRTREMHEEAELGVAAHWRYKEGAPATGDRDFERQLAWLRRILESADEHDEDLIDRFRAEVFVDRVYVLTPDHDVIDLPRGATPLDFAYHIHTEVGHHCRGARVDGRMVPLTRPLENGERVEILTARDQRPSRDWLNPELGYLHTSRARGHVRAWFRQRDHDKNVSAGRQVLDRELRRLGVQDVSVEELARRSRHVRSENFLAALGRGEITSGRMAGLLRDRLLPERPAAPASGQRPGVGASGDAGDVTIHGVGSLMTRMAGCCAPTPGESVAGFITRGHGVTVHRVDCRNLARLAEQEPERIIEVDWSTRTAGRYTVRIGIRTDALDALLGEVTQLLSGEDVRLAGVQSASDGDGYRVELGLEVRDVGELSRVMSRLSGCPHAEDVRRVDPDARDPVL